MVNVRNGRKQALRLWQEWVESGHGPRQLRGQNVCPVALAK
jgi:hypothetical protein